VGRVDQLDSASALIGSLVELGTHITPCNQKTGIVLRQLKYNWGIKKV
jgi:hypothetical protein